MIIGLTGYAQSGKDTVAGILVEKYGFRRLAFADAIRELAYEMNPMIGFVANEPRYLRDRVDSEGWDTAKLNPEIRRILQDLGVGGRKIIDRGIWINHVMKQIGGVDDRVVIADVRFANEANLIKESEGSQIWRVKRVGYGPVNNHVSESEMDGYKVDQIFINNGSIDELQHLIQIRMSGMIVAKPLNYNW